MPADSEICNAALRLTQSSESDINHQVHYSASLVLSVFRLPPRTRTRGCNSLSDSYRDSHRNCSELSDSLRHSHRDSHRDRSELSNSHRTVLARRNESVVSWGSLAIVEEERDQNANTIATCNPDLEEVTCAICGSTDLPVVGHFADVHGCAEQGAVHNDSRVWVRAGGTWDLCWSALEVDVDCVISVVLSGSITGCCSQEAHVFSSSHRRAQAPASYVSISA